MGSVFGIVLVVLQRRGIRREHDGLHGIVHAVQAGREGTEVPVRPGNVLLQRLQRRERLLQPVLHGPRFGLLHRIRRTTTATVETNGTASTLLVLTVTKRMVSPSTLVFSTTKPALLVRRIYPLTLTATTALNCLTRQNQWSKLSASRACRSKRTTGTTTTTTKTTTMGTTTTTTTKNCR